MRRLDAGDRVEINPGEWATIIAYQHQHDGGNGNVPHGRVMFRWRNLEHAVSTASWHDGWTFGNSTYFMAGLEIEAAECWAAETGQQIYLASPEPACLVNGCEMFGGAPTCELCPLRVAL